MTESQFAAIAELISLREGPAKEAARLALVEGVSYIDAATRAGVSRQSESATRRRVIAAMKLAEAATTPPPPSPTPVALSV